VREGTKSYLMGCHQFLLHPLWVLLAWRLEYKSWPKFWQIVCIFLHDIGHIGKQYLSNPYEKQIHWVPGANIAEKLFGIKGFRFVAGHSSQSGFSKSKLWKADKRSWLVAPMWWLWINYYIEWHNSPHKITPPPLWKNLMRQNLASDNPIGSHELYLKHRY
jgi:hypothetical protein